MTLSLDAPARLVAPLDRVADAVLTSAARLIFAAVLTGYFWASALTKLDGIFTPSLGAYAQIFPRAMEAAGYDAAQLGLFHWAVVMAGTYAEFILPALLLAGLLTRLAALGMIGFITVQSLTDLIGHGGIAHPETLGAWFDRLPDGLILDPAARRVLVVVVLCSGRRAAVGRPAAVRPIGWVKNPSLTPRARPLTAGSSPGASALRSDHPGRCISAGESDQQVAGGRWARSPRTGPAQVVERGIQRPAVLDGRQKSSPGHSARILVSVGLSMTLWNHEPPLRSSFSALRQVSLRF